MRECCGGVAHCPHPPSAPSPASGRREIACCGAPPCNDRLTPLTSVAYLPFWRCPKRPSAMPSTLQALNRWVDEVARLTQPDAVHWCDGSDEENKKLIAQMERDGTLIPLNAETHPDCWLHRSHPSDVARVEHLTFVCTHERGRRRPEQSLDGARRRARESRCAVRRRDARPHDVRDSVLHGPDRFADRALRRRDHRQPLRRRQHAHHDAHGRAGARAHRARRHASSKACIRSASSIPRNASSCISPKS